ncbi:transmembrane epididymal protein 1A-like [Peromyscus californicus insignis]|uniref:transmembrane epididymal protein 1A-like n=1 Tax=Peromyscus californicus insignis TaxID=564181 RepID=UPI0022A74683|nr:transmembrane epididymal protein 1A-like [Peromyscus californicus insignis]
MGDFIGHVYPGLFLALYGLYQAIVVSRAMIFSDSLLYPSSLSKNKGRWARLWQIAHTGWLKAVTGALLIIYVLNCVEGGLKLMSKGIPPRFMFPREWQHLTMFVLLTLDGCTEIVSKNVLRQRWVVLERGSTVLAIYVLLLLLVSHVKDSSGVELQVHSLLILVVFLLMLVLTAELWAPEMLHLWMIETFLFLMMGTWLMQAGFILFRPVSGYPWEDDDISDIMFVTTFFCWHVMINALCLVGVYGFSSLWHHYYRPSLRLGASKKVLYHESSSGTFYQLLQDAEQQDQDDQVLLPSKSSACDRA